MYQCYDYEHDDLKKSTKGVPHKNEFSMELFRDVLLDDTTPRQTAPLSSLRRNRDKEMSRMLITKSTLSDIFVKMQVQPDKISCKPLQNCDKTEYI